jgi:hypothetical protein
MGAMVYPETLLRMLRNMAEELISQDKNKYLWYTDYYHRNNTVS